VSTGRRRPGLPVAPLRKFVRRRGPGGRGIVVARACPWSRQGKAGKVGPSGDRGVTGSQGELQADGQWVRFPAELNSGRAGGGEHKNRRRCRDGVTLC
jgi:hypothetical protein